jgi:tetratricopeptide (TPR) repeat protein
MGKKRRKQIGLVILAGFVILLPVGGFLIWLAPEPPQKELRLAREALVDAQKAGAAVYAPRTYKEAQQLYDSAMVYWSGQNDRFFLNRDYEMVHSLVERVIRKANEAAKSSVQLANNTNSLVKKGIAGLGMKVKLYERAYKQMPLPTSITNAHNKGKMKLSEARIAYENGRFNEAKQHFEKAEELIDSSNDKAEKLLKAWFAHYPQWKKHGEEAVRLSKRQKVVLIDKYAHRCVVYQNGKPTKGFEAELGINWMGDKRRKGDKATPEGVYRVSQKKEGARTKFYKALLINYPNDEDRKRIAAEKKNGTLSSHADIGGLIEIHGHGGKGIDWTDGCVALKNTDMDILFRLVDNGTLVVIVGSLKPMNEIFSEK